MQNSEGCRWCESHDSQTLDP